MANKTGGPQGQLYADPAPSPDETSFQQDNTSDAYYNSAYYQAHQDQVQPFPAALNTTPLNLANFLPADLIDAITSAGKIVFHAVGDTGAAKVTSSQTAAQALGNEGAVADAMTAEVASAGAAFFFHLGDVIYQFGEAQYYYDQFYEPFRNYDRPIFAIPGNHDGMVYGDNTTAPAVPTLAAFLANFCATRPAHSPNAGGLMRTTMTQPGVYFSLDAPFVSIIGLYSNVLEGPGVISSQGGAFAISDEQLNFLQAQLSRLKMLRIQSPRAVILALHHPPLSVDAKHGGSTGPLTDIDACCAAAGFWPDMVLSGHAHLYQRFTRTVAAAGGKQTPYIVSGSGGYAATPPQESLPPAPVTGGDATLVVDPIVAFGYLTLTCDGETLTATFSTADASGVAVRDEVSVALTQGTIVGSAPEPAPHHHRKRKPKPEPPKNATKASGEHQRRSMGSHAGERHQHPLPFLVVRRYQITEPVGRVCRGGARRLLRGTHQPMTTQTDVVPHALAGVAERMESLGRNCEFGYVQRRLGIEPISLLRWAGGPTSGLVAGLLNGFAGLAEEMDGQPNPPRVDPEKQVWWLTCRRYGLRFHTGQNIMKNTVEQAAVKVRPRLRWQAESCSPISARRSGFAFYSSADFAHPRYGLEVVEAIREIGGAGPVLIVAPGGQTPVAELEENAWGARIPRLTTMNEAVALDLDQWRRVLTEASTAIPMLQSLAVGQE